MRRDSDAFAVSAGGTLADTAYPALQTLDPVHRPARPRPPAEGRRYGRGFWGRPVWRARS